MKQLATMLIVYFLLGFSTKAQCDVAITGVDLNTYEVTIEVINSAGCIAAPIGGTPGKVSQIQIGYHLPEPFDEDNAIVDLMTLPDAPCSPQWFDAGYNLGMNEDSNHLGWWFSPSTSTTFDADIMGNGLVTGDVVTIPLNPLGDWPNGYPVAECSDDLIDYWLSEDECIEFVLWQINYGNTWYQGNGGWASLVSNSDYAPGTYQDQNCNNSWYLCRDENPGAAVASPDFACPPDAPDAVIDNIEFEIGCIGDVPAYQLTYTVYNYGNEDITDYCVEMWNEDYYQCFSEDLFGAYGIPVGEGQQFITPFFEFTGNPGGFFTMSVDSVNDEIVTGNNNTTVYFPDEWPECPEVCEPDTITEYVTDTIYETDTLYITEYLTDTVYVETIDTLVVTEFLTDTIYLTETLYLTDTLYITEYIIDTLFLTEIDSVFIDNYIYFTDTITEYIVQELWIDCETGLPCDEEPPGILCPDWATLFIPNTFTPNNDGLNDAWKVEYDLDCWEYVEFEIFNRWGGRVFYGDTFWDGSINGGSYYVADGVYTYTVKAKRYDRPNIIQKSGHITVFR